MIKPFQKAMLAVSFMSPPLLCPWIEHCGVGSQSCTMLAFQLAASNAIANRSLFIIFNVSFLPSIDI